MTRPRAASGLAAAIAVLGGLAGLAGCSQARSSAPAGLAGDPPQFVQAEALAAAQAAGSVHVDMTSSSGSGGTVYSADVSSGAGRQVITITGGGQATVLDVAGVGYVTGNRTALASFSASRPPRPRGWPAGGSRSAPGSRTTSRSSRP